VTVILKLMQLQKAFEFSELIIITTELRYAPLTV